MRRKNSRRTGIYTGILLFLVLPGASVYAQDVAFTASVSTSRIVQNTVFEVQFELQNANGSDFVPPSFEGFRVVGGPSIGSSTMIINGAVTRSRTWSYSLLAQKQGKFSIGSASIVAGRKKLMSKPIPLEVIAAEDLSTPGAGTGREPVLLKAEVPEGPFYPGQQILLTYRLLFRENVQTVSTLAEDDYSDFFIQHFQDISTEATYETVNGVQFTSRVIKVLALFAHQSGTFTLDPMLMSVGINAPFPGNQGFFTMRRIQDVQVASNPVSISILPLPSGAPPAFSGAVGQYSIQTIPGRQQITTDEAFTFQIQITGNGDSRRWDLPMPVADGPFEIFDPKVEQDQVTAIDGQISSIRTASYQMIPSSPGTYAVHVPLTYFDPATKQYRTIGSDTMVVQVAQGLHKPRVTFGRDTAVAEIPELMKIRVPLLKDRFWWSAPHLFLLGLILAGSGWGWMTAQKRKREQHIPETERIRMGAGHVAQKKLDQLEALSGTLSSKDFFEQATEIYYSFLSDRFAIPASELDESGIARYLGNAAIKPAEVEKARSFFNQCLAVRYGGIPGGFTREEMLAECRAVTAMLQD